MSLLSVNVPGLVHVAKHARNGMYPDAAFYATTTAALNHATAFARKPIFRRTCKLGQAGRTSGVAWRWHCRTGYGARRLAVVCVLGRDDSGTAVDPYIEVSATKVGGSTTTIAFHGGVSATAAGDGPDEWIPSIQYIAVDGASYYTGAVEFFDGVRVVALMVYEDAVPTVADGTDYHSTFEPAAGSPILDSRIGRQLAGIGAMHRVNGGLRADWCHVSGTARTRTSATLINLIDNSTTGTPTAASPGFTLNTQYRNTVSAATVPITFAVYAAMLLGGSGSVKLRDTAGTDAASATITSATPAWVTVTGALTVGTAQKYDVLFAGDGANTVTVYAVSFYEDADDVAPPSFDWRLVTDSVGASADWGLVTDSVGTSNDWGAV